MQSSESRSSSAVRNLRSMFENKASESNVPDIRGRSPNGLGSDKENGYRPKAKVHASFVPVEPVPSMSVQGETAGQRRGSFGEADGDLDLKKTISEQQEVLEVPEGVVESVGSSAVGTPLRIPTAENDVPATTELDEPPSNPDKPVTGAEEAAGDMKPADPSDEAAVSGGEALPPVAEDLRTTEQPAAPKPTKAKATTASGKPPAISTKTTTKSTASLKSPASQPKTPVSAKASLPNDSAATKKPPRASLTAPTAASMARSGGSDKPPSTKTSPPTKAKPREVTKPLNISSHLTAPTAASKARHETDAAPASSNSTFRTSVASRVKPSTTTTKPTPRSSLAAAPRPASRDSTTTARRSLAPVDGSFLDRMTRPTAASANRTAEKVEVKSPPKAKASVKPKVNGHSSKPAPKPAPEEAPEAEPTAEAPSEEPEAAAPPGLSFAGDATTVEKAVPGTDNHFVGSETPEHTTNGTADAVALEATPAGLGGEDTIR